MGNPEQLAKLLLQQADAINQGQISLEGLVPDPSLVTEPELTPKPKTSRAIQVVKPQRGLTVRTRSLALPGIGLKPQAGAEGLVVGQEEGGLGDEIVQKAGAKKNREITDIEPDNAFQDQIL
ncbi:hypothetical protein ACFL0Y_02910 [Patescibacteria group bacterium]